MRLLLLATSLLAATVLLGAEALESRPRPEPWWTTPPRAGGPPVEGVVPGILDDTWWKLKVSAKGYRVDAVTGLASPAAFKTTAYMRLAVPAPLPGDGVPGVQEYEYLMWTEIDPGVWSAEYGDSFFAIGLDANGNHALNVNTFFGFDTQEQAVASSHSGRLVIKVDGQGQLKGAKLKTLAGEVVDSTLDTSVPGEAFFGSMKIKGTTIDFDDLPFVPF